MTFIESIKSCYGKYATFSGRATRSEYWWFVLATWLFSLLVLALFSLAGYLIIGDNDAMGIFGGGMVGLASLLLFGMFNFLPMLSVSVRRLHDIGRGGDWWLIQFLPGIGTIWFLVLMLTGSDDENRYGLPEY